MIIVVVSKDDKELVSKNINEGYKITGSIIHEGSEHYTMVLDNNESKTLITG